MITGAVKGNNVAAMSFSDSYLGRLRTRIGSDLVLMPGAIGTDHPG